MFIYCNNIYNLIYKLKDINHGRVRADNNVLNATILADNGPSQPSSSAKTYEVQQSAHLKI